MILDSSNRLENKAILNVVDTSGICEAFVNVCRYKLGSKADEVLAAVDVAAISQTILSSIIQPIIQRSQIVAKTYMQGCVDYLASELTPFGIHYEDVYDIVAGVESYALRKLLEILPNIDSEDVHVESIEYKAPNTAVIKIVVDVDHH